MTNYIKKHPILFIIILALVTRGIFALVFPISNQAGGDLPLYQRITESILTEGNFGGEPQKTYGSPYISPGFAFFLVGWEFFFGESGFSLLIASIFMSGLLAAGVYLLARHFFGTGTALAAGVIAAFFPVFLIQTLAYGESLMLYTTALVWGIYLFVRAVQRDRLRLALLSGAVLGFAALVDAIAFFVPLLLIFWAFFVRRSFRVVVPVVLFLMVIGLVLAPWAHRNAVMAERVGDGASAPIVSKGELQLVSFDGLSLIAELVARQGMVASGLSKIFVFPYGISLLDQYSAPYKEKFFTLVGGTTAIFSVKELVVLFAKAALTLLHWLVLALAAVGAVWLARRREWKFPLLVLLLTGYVVAAVIGYGSITGGELETISLPSSFLFPLVPLYIVLGARVLFLLFSGEQTHEDWSNPSALYREGERI